MNQLLSFGDEEEPVVLVPIVKKKKSEIEFKKDFEPEKLKKKTNFTFSSRTYNKNSMEELKNQNIQHGKHQNIEMEAPEITMETKKIYKNENDEIVEEEPIIDLTNEENGKNMNEIKTFDHIEIEAAKNKRKIQREKENFIPLEKKKEEEEDSSSSSSSDDEEAFDQHKENRISFGVEEKPKRPQYDDIEDELENEGINEWEELQMKSAGFVPKHKKSQNSLNVAPAPKFEGIIPFDKIGNELDEIMDKMMDDYEKEERDIKRLAQDIKEIQKGIDHDQRDLEGENVKYMFYQEMKDYLENLLDCLDTKVPDIEEAENEVLSHREAFYKKKRDLWKQYQKDKMTKFQSLEQIQRIKEFETMDSNVPSLNIETKFFDDVQEEYNSIDSINIKFQEWKTKFPETYKEAYVEESLSKVFAPYIRLQLFSWNPISVIKFTDFPWFESMKEHSSILQEIIKKVVFPLVSHSISKCYNPFSEQETQNCVALIEEFIKYKALSEDIYISLLERILLFVEEFDVPKFDELDQFSKDQFFRGIHLVKNICQWKDKLRSKSIQHFLQMLVKEKLYKSIPGYTALKKRVLEVIPLEFQRGLD